MSTYPYLPGLPDDDDEDSASAHGRKRLALFSHHKRPNQSSTAGQSQKQGQNAGLKEKEGHGLGSNSASGHAGSGAHGGSQGNVGPGGKTATRSDVKETLKSMGLRCEDFTISVYSREQAHAILRRQGVEVTPNNLPPKEKSSAISAKGGFKNAKSTEVPKISHNMRTGSAPNSRNAIAHYDGNVDDDDDCVILDPPDMPKCTPKLPQQFQLMGTTVQVNRGAKRPSRPMANQPQAKRPNSRPMMYYRKEHDQDYSTEASVQDTLKRLKNYNISITCRRNASGLRPQGVAVDSDSDMENDSHLDSDEDGEDMTKYLECQIGEVEDMQDMQEEEIFEEELDIDCDDKDDVDYNPRGKKRRQKNKSPRKGKKTSESGSVGDKTNRDSLVNEIPEIVPSVEMGELSDHHGSNASDNEYDHDPLAEENYDNRELREIMENAVQLEEGDGNQNTNRENGTNENSNEGHPEGETGSETNEENKNEENKEESGNILGEFVETEETGSPSQREGAAPDEEEEIDEELEKELLGGDLGDGEEGDMEEDL